MPKVSVIIPCHNYARYLPDAVESVAQQTFKDLEIIIVNDGSTDDTQSVAGGLAGRYGQVIRVINQENMGVAAARNNGIRESLGEYFIPLDADDVLDPVYIERLLPVLEADPGAGLCYSWTEKFGDETGLIRHRELGREALLKNEGPSCTSIIRRAAWERAGGYNTLMKEGFEDWEFHLSLFEAGYKSIVVPEALFMYRRHGPSRMDGTLKNILRVYRNIKLLHPKLYEPYLCGISVTLARAVIWLKSWTRDPVMRYIYERHPRFHEKLRELKYGRMK